MIALLCMHSLLKQSHRRNGIGWFMMLLLMRNKIQDRLGWFTDVGHGVLWFYPKDASRIADSW